MWHFVTKSTGLKSVKLRMSNHLFKSIDPTYVNSAMCPKCPKKEWQIKSFRLQSTPPGKRPKVCPRSRCTRHMISVKPGMSSHFSESRDPSYVSSSMCPECLRKEWRISPSGYSPHPRESGPEAVQGGVTASPTLLSPVLVRSQENYVRLLLIVRYFGSS